MFDICRQSSKRKTWLFVWVAVLSVAWVHAALGADTYTATKASDGTVTQPAGFFSIGPPGQVVNWTALYQGSGSL